LRLMELSVGELAQVLGQSQPRVSRHLKVLADAGVLDRRKEGSWVFLTLAEAHRVEPLFALIDEWADSATQSLFAADATRTESIRADRAEAANRYFAGHAEVWDQIRSLHVAESEVERAIGKLENDLRRPPTDGELADELGVSIDDLQDMLNQINLVSVVALDELLSPGGEKGEKVSLVDTLEDEDAPDPVMTFESEETRQILAKSVNILPERERLVITLYYYEGLTLAEIGSVLGVTESRVCQMHTKAVLELRNKMNAEISD